MTGAYSQLKIFHHQGRLESIRKGDRPKPLHLHLVPTNRCNQNCSFCAYRSHGYTSSERFYTTDEIPVPKLLEVVESCSKLGIKSVELTGGGEPTLHPAFSDLCFNLRERGIDYAIVTNGMLLDVTPILDAATKSQWIRFSIDAGSSQTYKETRRVDCLGRVRNNLRGLVRLRGSTDCPTIGVGFVVTKNNWNEVLRACKHARDDGADNFRISAVFQNQGAEYFRGFHQKASELCAEAETLSSKGFTVFNLFGDRINDLSQESPDYKTCYTQQLVTYLGADQNLYRCCVTAYNQRGLIGSVKEQSLYDLWQSKETWKRLQTFDAKRCHHCMFNQKNRTIAYAVESNPDHVNFL